MSSGDVAWQPSRIVRLVEALPTGSSVVRVETDLGEGFLKALSNKAEPHNLACELVGTYLARYVPTSSQARLCGSALLLSALRNPSPRSVSTRTTLDPV